MKQVAQQTKGNIHQDVAMEKILQHGTVPMAAAPKRDEWAVCVLQAPGTAVGTDFVCLGLGEEHEDVARQFHGELV